MAEPKGLGSRILGAFLTTDDEGGEKPDASEAPAGEKSAADLVAELAQGVASASAATGVAPAASPAGPGLQGGGNLDFESVYRDAGLDAVELDRVRKAEELLKGLPAGIGKDVQRQIVEASLKAFGFEVAKIVGAAQMQLKALDKYVRAHEGLTQKAVTEAEAQIKQLEERIAGVKKDVEKRRGNLQSTTLAAQARKAQVDQVLEFFAAPAAPAGPKPGGG